MLEKLLKLLGKVDKHMLDGVYRVVTYRDGGKNQ